LIIIYVHYNFMRYLYMMFIAVFLFVAWRKFKDRLGQSSSECLLYRNILPNGYCVDVLHDKMVLNSPSHARAINGNLLLALYGLKKLTESSSLELAISNNRIYSLINSVEGKCKQSEVPRIKSILLSMNSTKADLVNAVRCMKEHKWFICHSFHATCLQNKNTSQVINSPMCYEEISRMKTKPHCLYIMKVLSKCLQLHRLCPNMFAGGRLDFESYPRLKMPDLEICQKETEELNHGFNEENCDKSNGEQYNGFLNTTSSGKQCQEWKLNPYLNNVTYSTLASNYCRNPQGYGQQPWCYTDYEKGEWEYCQINQCKEEELQSDWSFWWVYVIIPVSIVLILILLILYKRLRKVNDYSMEDIQPYSSAPVSDVLKNTFVYLNDNDRKDNAHDKDGIKSLKHCQRIS